MNAPLLSASFTESAAQRFVEACGADYDNTPYGPAARFPGCALASEKDFIQGVVAPLPDWGLVSISGAEASAFLHAQVTNDIEHLKLGAVQLNGYCSPKGRLLVSALNWRDETAIHLLVARALAAPLRKRLGMFVLRAKAVVSDASDSSACFGLAGAAAAAALTRCGGRWPDAGGVVGVGDATALGLPAIRVGADSIPRALLLAPADQAGTLWQSLSAMLSPISSEQWRWTDVRAGIPRIVPAGVEHFVPQMVNFDLVGGVSFKKGCYPGQEIVARSHYLGKLKRRMFAARVAGPEPAPATDLFSEVSTEPCGEVVTAAPAPDGSTELLFECQISAVPQARLDAQRRLEPLPLPYEMPAP